MNFISSNLQTADFEKHIERLARRAGIMRVVIAGATAAQREEKDTEATRCEQLAILLKQNVRAAYDEEIERLEASRQDKKNWSFLRFSENRRGLTATSKATIIDREITRLTAQSQHFQNIAVPAAGGDLNRPEPRLYAMIDAEARRLFWQQRMKFPVIGSFMRPLLERINLRETMSSQNMRTFLTTYHCHMADVAYYYVVAPRLEVARAALIASPNVRVAYNPVAEEKTFFDTSRSFDCTWERDLHQVMPTLADIKIPRHANLHLPPSQRAPPSRSE
ncbi:hypothetical protein CBER1_03164 [Cercospora berteroae]|uniref:Uncharacterized protein n=1 Tax=Cercospora berteroae TaxID=357750 RepID=A0A2S6CL58_9PEZI|nr:hypothetical protein CBER1_03164 [Cercospora berteroae]